MDNQEQGNLSEGLSDGLGQKIVEALQEQAQKEPDSIKPSESMPNLAPSRADKTKAINVASENYVLSENITKLMTLVNDLPESIEKKSGALIIKQTMEAMGVSMKTLMIEAKQVQENINGNIRTCMGDIEEAKNTIKQLEDQIVSYKNLSNELNDLIGLFIVSDKD